ncbi:MAG: gliding motility-associated C-terminal domain-containing protein, partial [Flavobacteriales bacterium]|nr:gliding motility-associated C-terminal domain-containing protein [Flavobacteriales bacterium]
MTVVVGSGLDPGIGGSDVICGGNTAYNLFNSLGGTPSPGGVWSEASGTPALNTATGELDASQLPANTPFLFSYTVTDPGCGVASSVLNITVTDYPDPGADGAATVCAGGPAFSLFSLLGGTPQPGGTWTTTGGTAVPAVFDPATQVSGTFLYNLQGTAPCGDTTATVVVTVNQPADAGADNTLTRCNAGSYDLTESLMPGAQPGGTWEVVQGTAVLNGSVIQLGDLSPGLYGFLYTVTVAGCGSNDARITLNVVDGVRVTDTLLVCNEQDRTYTVILSLSGGDPATYSVTGLDGSTSDVAPFVFTSAPVLTSVPFAVVVTDANDCEPITIDGVSPCVFDDAVFVPESFTPNGDGINDRLVIPGIEGYPANTIDIFNRWGGAVYSAAGYNNGSVAWDGTSTAALIPGELPTGTYYYVLDLG